ncbi:MAG: hypothetical protein LBL13_11270 [Bacteroidales bacterium]|jgi:hypothetical protein|nr:hypothetical protein [Bacteroidales bacterium]
MNKVTNNLVKLTFLLVVLLSMGLRCRKEVQEIKNAPKFLKHCVNDIDSIYFYCNQMGYDGVEFDLIFFHGLSVFHHDTNMAQPFKPFANVIIRNKNLTFWIDLTHNITLNSKDNINKIFAPLLGMLPYRQRNYFFETNDSLVLQYLQRLGYQTIYWIQPFLSLDSSNVIREDIYNHPNISFERNMYDYVCMHFANHRKFIYVDSKYLIDTTKNISSNDAILQDMSVEVILLDDLRPPKYINNTYQSRINKLNIQYSNI